MHLAAFNIGILRYAWDDPRIVDFADNIDRVNAVAQRSPGFVWQLHADAMEAAQTAPDGPLGNNPRTASTLSVWTDLESLKGFVFNTVHKKFYDRRAEWYDVTAQGWNGQRLVLWHVQTGHRPTIADAVARLTHLARHGDSDMGFGWDYARNAA
ncbi:DUF3291 domain-containing protein [Aliishimia ponticola]|uniref:DUF3291 domain-containing protein n=1 Tax=Aliishimia ponticola TaxID=2499833 RepID=A0A4S4NH46_9RHOB|nr:DUF3291 domain-containing protein [Aliishimia ponticola]THH38992.1 DUF3291 domain-containing protein [Aliishimia ponticola]